MSKRVCGIKKFLLLFVIFAIVATATTFLIMFITKTGVFRIPGKVIYDESLNEGEISKLQSIFTKEVDLDKDVTISATETLEKPDLKTGEFLLNIYVPVTDFYSTETSIDSAEYFIDGKIKHCNCGVTWKEFDDLNFSETLLAIDGKYYLDTLSEGAAYRYITFKSEAYDKEIAPLVEGVYTKTFPEKDEILTFAQTGVTALSRGMDTKLRQVGMDATYFAKNIGEYLSSFDLTHTSNESSFASGTWTRKICSEPSFINTLTAIGLDIVELTGNHNNDCGYDAARDTASKYLELGMKIVGGGRNAEEAAQPLKIEQKGTNITMLAYNQSTGGATYGSLPGANQYYESDAAARIAAAKAKGDFVIVDVQYYECNNYDTTYENTACDYANSSAGDQVGLFRHLIDLGADVVVGTAAHQPQTFELYGNGVIYYGLGNLFFDQIWWPGTTRSLILSHYFYNGKLLQTKIVPTVYDGSMQTKLMDEETAKWYLERLAKVRPSWSFFSS